MQLPIDYRTPYLRLLETRDSSKDDWHEYKTQMPSIGMGIDQVWRLLEPLLIGIGIMHTSLYEFNPKPWSPRLASIARVEFIWRQDQITQKEFRGAVLFDNGQQPVIHVPDALLGYAGNGPGLSENILTALGVPVEMFCEASASVTAHNYDSVVFSREALQSDIYTDIDFSHDDVISVSSPLGKIQARPYAPVQWTWNWWIG